VGAFGQEPTFVPRLSAAAVQWAADVRQNPSGHPSDAVHAKNYPRRRAALAIWPLTVGKPTYSVARRSPEHTVLYRVVLAPNAEALAALAASAHGQGEPFALVRRFVWTAKTHLPQATCQVGSPAGTPPSTCHRAHTGLTPEAPAELDGPRVGQLDLDDGQTCAVDPGWEEHVFTLSGRVRDTCRGILVTAQPPPSL